MKFIFAIYFSPFPYYAKKIFRCYFSGAAQDNI